MRVVMAIDPGTSKCGIAVVKKEGSSEEIIFRTVAELSDVGQILQEADQAYSPDLVVVGNGTNTKTIQHKIREVLPGRAILILDERDTSIRARERYWVHHPRRGWRRLLPSTLQVPPVAIDDFVAVILAERALSVE